ncbi:conserved hypothetical protein [Uncinocarpus reesii 1704]|uniref:Uncharacterized protein n=1 Tax=Uncinocarpus reesii (strain UAMH 1704) TaxID=336963 RepID=C4JSB4_UNCRE|nr:uncharacterized protein UREG_05353 [Uncinocarpus reesii 1704]EEP80511.1 conserved hypothetical protein [Uncinocarpus reesii 1704]
MLSFLRNAFCSTPSLDLPSVLLVVGTFGSCIRVLHLLPEDGTIERLSLTTGSTKFRRGGTKEQAREQIGTITLDHGNGETAWGFLDEIEPRVRKLWDDSLNSKPAQTESIEVIQLANDVLKPDPIGEFERIWASEKRTRPGALCSLYTPTAAMPPRLRLSTCSKLSQSLRHESKRQSRATIGAAFASQFYTPSLNHTRAATTAAAVAATPTSYPPTQPPSHRRPEYRKTQLHRQYTSLLRTMPLILLFQHNNLKSIEWVNIRRELSKALRTVDENHIANGRTDVPPLADAIKMQTINTNIFEVALRVVDFFRPETAGIADSASPIMTHDLSEAAFQAVLNKRGKHELAALLVGPIALVTFPYVSPEHVKAALSILAPSPPTFPAPKRRVNPGYYELETQSGLQKLVLLGARVEGKVFDDEGTRWIGSIEGGMGGLRAQLVHLLQSAGASLTGTLEGAGKSLYLTMESRRSVLEEEQNGGKKEE